MHLCLLSTSLQMGCCGIPELHGQCCEQFRTTPEQRINVELWPVRFPESVPPLLLRSHLSLCWADRCDRRRACPLAPFRTLCHFVLCATRFTCRHVRTWKQHRATHYLAEPSVQCCCHCTSTYRPNVIPSVACYLYHKSCLLPNNSALYRHRSYRLGIITY